MSDFAILAPNFINYPELGIYFLSISLMVKYKYPLTPAPEVHQYELNCSDKLNISMDTPSLEAIYEW